MTKTLVAHGCCVGLLERRCARLGADLSEPDHHHRLAGAGRRRHRHASAAALAQRFSKAWGQQAVVENKPGANNQLAAEYVANAPPDGHTLFIAPDGTFVANPSLYPKLPYDPYKSFTPITGLVIINHGLIAHPSFPANNVKELHRARQEASRARSTTAPMASARAAISTWCCWRT